MNTNFMLFARRLDAALSDCSLWLVSRVGKDKVFHEFMQLIGQRSA